MSKQHQPFAYHLSYQALLVYYAGIGAALWLMLNRNKPEPWASLPSFMTTWGQHTSNFALTFLLFTSICLFWVMQDVPKKMYAWLAGIFVAMNVIVELVVPVLNTRDVMDIPFGIAGVLCGLPFIYFFYKTRVKIPPKKT